MYDGRWWAGGGGGVGVMGQGGVAQHRRAQNGGAMMAACCMCCVYKADVFRKQNYKRFDEGQFTMVGCKTHMSKQ